MQNQYARYELEVEGKKSFLGEYCRNFLLQRNYWISPPLTSLPAAWQEENNLTRGCQVISVWGRQHVICIGAYISQSELQRRALIGPFSLHCSILRAGCFLSASFVTIYENNFWNRWNRWSITQTLEDETVHTWWVCVTPNVTII